MKWFLKYRKYLMPVISLVFAFFVAFPSSAADYITPAVESRTVLTTPIVSGDGSFTGYQVTATGVIANISGRFTGSLTFNYSLRVTNNHVFDRFVRGTTIMAYFYDSEGIRHDFDVRSDYVINEEMSSGQYKDCTVTLMLYLRNTLIGGNLDFYIISNFTGSPDMYFTTNSISCTASTLIQESSSTSSFSDQLTDINNSINSQTGTLTDGYDNSGLNSSGNDLSNSVNDYDNIESNLMTNVDFSDVELTDAFSLPAFVNTTTLYTSFLQGIYTNLGDAGIIVICSLCIAFAFALIGYRKYLDRGGG